MTDSSRMAAALTEAARTIHGPRSLTETLDTIVQTAVMALPAFDHAGVSITHRDGQIETVAGTDPLVWELDSLQYELDEGPCLDSLRTDPVVLVENAAQEHRWANYIPKALSSGLRAQLGLRLYIQDETLGGLNLYSTRADQVDPESRELAELFATHAAIALGRARHEDRLNQAIASRKVIGQAVGIIMERYQLPEDRAFQYLIRTSQSKNVKLRAVAQEIADEARSKYARRADPADA